MNPFGGAKSFPLFCKLSSVALLSNEASGVACGTGVPKHIAAEFHQHIDLEFQLLMNYTYLGKHLSDG